MIISHTILRYLDLALDIFIENLERIKSGKDPVNRVDPKRGY
jgi:hypothetical protein